MDKPHTDDDLTQREFDEVMDAVENDDIDVVDDEEAEETARIKAELKERERDRTGD